jgi:pilus assembly protein CpaB
MKLTIIGLVLLGAVAAISAAVLATSLRMDAMRSVRAANEEPVEIEVLIATRDLGPMTVVDAEAVTTRKILNTEAPQGACTHTVQVIGQIVQAGLLEGQIFLTSSFVGDEAGVHLASTLPEGGRAMTIVVAEDSGLEGLLYPGCMVDIVASFRLPSIPGKPAGEVASATLLQNVRVLAVNHRSVVSGDDGLTAPTVEGKKKQMITLLVDRKQSEALQLATAHGTVSLALRNPLDSSVGTGQGVLLSELSDDIASRLAALAIGDVAGDAPPLQPGDAPLQDLAAGLGGSLPGAPKATAPAVEQPEAEVTQATWTTVVVRGRTVEKQEFPMEEVDPREGEGAEASGRDDTNKDGSQP